MMVVGVGSRRRRPWARRSRRRGAEPRARRRGWRRARSSPSHATREEFAAVAARAPCAHHKLASAVWLELDAAEGSISRRCRPPSSTSSPPPTRRGTRPAARARRDRGSAAPARRRCRAPDGVFGDGGALGTRAEPRPEDGGSPSAASTSSTRRRRRPSSGRCAFASRCTASATWCLQREGEARGAREDLVSRVETFTRASPLRAAARRRAAAAARRRVEARGADGAVRGVRLPLRPEPRAEHGLQAAQPPAPPAREARGRRRRRPGTVGVEGGKRKRAFEEMKADGARKRPARRQRRRSWRRRRGGGGRRRRRGGGGCGSGRGGRSATCSTSETSCRSAARRPPAAPRRGGAARRGGRGGRCWRRRPGGRGGRNDASSSGRRRRRGAARRRPTTATRSTMSCASCCRTRSDRERRTRRKGELLTVHRERRAPSPVEPVDRCITQAVTCYTLLVQHSLTGAARPPWAWAGRAERRLRAWRLRRWLAPPLARQTCWAHGRPRHFAGAGPGSAVAAPLSACSASAAAAAGGGGRTIRARR